MVGHEVILPSHFLSVIFIYSISSYTCILTSSIRLLYVQDVALEEEPTLFEQVMSANLDDDDSDDDDDEEEVEERHDIVNDDDDDD